MSISKFVKRHELPNVGKFVRNDKSDQQVADNFKITGAVPTLTLEDITGAQADVLIKVDANVLTIGIVGGNDLVTINLNTGEAVFKKDLQVDAAGSSTSTPRILGTVNLNSGNAVRTQFGDAFNSFQTSFGGRMIIQSFHGLRIYGHTFGQTTGAEAPVGFQSNNTADPHVEFVGSNGGFSENVADNVHVQIRGAGNMVSGTTPFFRCVTSGGSDRFSILEDGDVTIQGTQVLTTRRTGWGAPTGTATRSSFATYTAPTISNPPTQAEVQAIANHLQVLSERLKALIDDLTTHGAIGA